MFDAENETAEALDLIDARIEALEKIVGAIIRFMSRDPETVQTMVEWLRFAEQMSRQENAHEATIDVFHRLANWIEMDTKPKTDRT